MVIIHGVYRHCSFNNDNMFIIIVETMTINLKGSIEFEMASNDDLEIRYTMRKISCIQHKHDVISSSHDVFIMISLVIVLQCGHYMGTYHVCSLVIPCRT